MNDMEYEDLFLMALFLLEKAGGEVEYTEQELTDFDSRGKRILVSFPPDQNHGTLRVIKDQ